MILQTPSSNEFRDDLHRFLRGADSVEFDQPLVVQVLHRCRLLKEQTPLHQVRFHDLHSYFQLSFPIALRV